MPMPSSTLPSGPSSASTPPSLRSSQTTSLGQLRPASAPKARAHSTAAMPPARLSTGSSCAGRAGPQQDRDQQRGARRRLPAPPAPAPAGVLHVGAHGREGRLRPRPRARAARPASRRSSRARGAGFAHRASGYDRRRDRPSPTPFGREEIEQLIPHRDPFLLIDEIVELEPGVRVVARSTVRGDEWFLRGHFPGRADHARRADGRGARPGRRGGRALAPRLPRARAALRGHRRRALPPRRASRRRARLRADRRPPAQRRSGAAPASCTATASGCSTPSCRSGSRMPESRRVAGPAPPARV